LDEDIQQAEVLRAFAEEELKAVCKRDIEEYNAECAERDQAQIQQIEDEERRLEEKKKDQASRELEAAAREDVKEYMENASDVLGCHLRLEQKKSGTMRR